MDERQLAQNHLRLPGLLAPEIEPSPHAGITVARDRVIPLADQ